jgi:hypothetical protein
MTLQTISAELAPSAAYRHLIEPSKPRQQVIGTMFGFLSKDLTQGIVKATTSDLPVISTHHRLAFRKAVAILDRTAWTSLLH